jgi:hypothetical protein
MLLGGQQDQANNILKENRGCYHLSVFLYEKEDVDICYRMLDTNIVRVDNFCLLRIKEKRFFLGLEQYIQIVMR